jgi:hypothetical protein
MRGRHFAVEYHLPDFHYQIAQFCQEVLTSLAVPGGPAEYLSDASGARYGLRLLSWWNHWTKADARRGVDATYEALRDQLRQVRTVIAASSHVDLESELMKVELWVRHNPGHDCRELALWASSAGVLRDRAILRSAELSLLSHNASVQAFIEGRPQYKEQEDLHRTTTPGAAADYKESRWRAFLAVPIRLATSEGDIPVGVITLATMQDKGNSAIPVGSTRDMERIVIQLRAVGGRLLSP